MADLLVPGYDVVELLGFGSGGEVWLARERATGSPVALKRLHADADLVARDRLRREAAVLAGIDHPHVLRLRSVVGAGESLVLVLDLATGGSLARLLATRGRLTPGEVVTIAVPLAQALAAIHAQGLVHGDVTPANVLFTADGRPVLSDLGVSRLIGAPHHDVGGTPGFLDPEVLAGGEAGPAADVHGLAATCLAALAGHPAYDESGCRAPLHGESTLLTIALESALVPDTDARPGAAELAAAVFEAAAAEPVQLVPGFSDRVAWAKTDVPHVTHRVARVPVGPVEPSPAGRARPLRARGAHRAGAERAAASVRRQARAWRRGLVVLLGATAVAMAIGGVLEGYADADRRPARVSSELPTVTSDRPAPAAGPPGQVVAGVATPARWAAVLASLDVARSRAFATADGVRLTEVYAPGAPALRRDLSVLDRLVGAGLRARGLRLTPVEVAVEVEAGAASPRQVRLRVEDVMPAYELVDRSGSVVESRAGRGRVRWTVTLERAGNRWLVYDVERE